MFSLAYFRRNEPALRGQRVHMRLPKSRDFGEWAALRGESRSFLEPWEPRWTADELDRSGWRLRLKRYREDFRLGTAGCAEVIAGALSCLRLHAAAHDRPARSA